MEDRVSNTFSTVFLERPPVERYATKACTDFVLISVKVRLPSLGRRCARRCDSAARVVLFFRFTATLVRHSFTNISSVIPDFGGILAAVFTRSRYGWKPRHAARSEMLLTGPSKTHRRTRLNVPFVCRTSSRYMP